MKVMKYWMIAAVVIILAACSNDTEHKLEGKWQLQQVEANGEVIQADTVFYNFQNILFMYQVYLADADSVTYKCLHSSAKGQGGNWSLYENPEMDALLEAARQEIDPDVRYELYTQVSELCKEDCPIIPVMQSTNTLTAWKDIQGVYGHPASAFLFQDYYWLTE